MEPEANRLTEFLSIESGQVLHDGFHDNPCELLRGSVFDVVLAFQ